MATGDDERINALIQTIEQLTEKIDKQVDGTIQKQIVIHRSEGIGNWGVAAVTACFLTYLSLILFAVWAYFQINNLWAWKDIHAGKISVLEAKQR